MCNEKAEDKAGRSYSLTYASGRIGEVGIEMVSTETILPKVEMFRGRYTLKLSGENVIAIAANDFGVLYVDYVYDDSPDITQLSLFALVTLRRLENWKLMTHLYHERS